MNPATQPASSTSRYAFAKANKPLQAWHEHIIDDMLAHPFDTNAVRAARLGYTEKYLSIIINSDMFKAAYDARRKRYQEMLDAALIEKTQRVADKGLDILMETLDKKRDALPFAVVAETTLDVLSKLGFGVQPKAGTQVNVQVNGAAAPVQVVASSEALAAARDRLRAVEEHNAAVALPPERPFEPERLVEELMPEQGVLDLEVIEATEVRDQRDDLA